MSEIIIFPWNKNFETGIEEVDQQHKRLVNLINQLANTLVHDDSIKLNLVFEELTEYAMYHFSYEEATWSEYFDKEDDWLAIHTRNHASFLPTLSEIEAQSSGEEPQTTAENILRFLIRWLTYHILDEDKRMGFVACGVKEGYSFHEAKEKANASLNGSTRSLIDIVLNMYESLSSHALELVREKHRRIRVENKLRDTNKKLEKLSITDDLTGLYNRRYFHELIPVEFRRAAREQLKMSFVSIDLDHFKKLNDQLGHLKGDEALGQVGKEISELCKRSGDFAFRMGGEELLVVISGSSPDSEIEVFADTIRKRIQQIQLCDQNQKVQCSLSASLGVFSKIPQGEKEYIQYLDRADKALYQAKEEGRNRVVVYIEKSFTPGDTLRK